MQVDRDKPILFCDAMVLALLAGTKRQTRRTMTRPGPGWSIESPPRLGRILTQPHPKHGKFGVFVRRGEGEFAEMDLIPAAYSIGQRLWVKECWRIGAWDENRGVVALDYRAGHFVRKQWLIPCATAKLDPTEVFEKLWIQSTDDCIAARIEPDAEGNYHWEPGEAPTRWRPSIFMSHWASRITLKVENVRVERLNDISAADCLAEGIVEREVIVGTVYENGHREITAFRYFFDGCTEEGFECPEDAYAALWDSINGAGAWEANPYVFVYDFVRED
jgi:hypothetical protein